MRQDTPQSRPLPGIVEQLDAELAVQHKRLTRRQESYNKLRDDYLALKEMETRGIHISMRTYEDLENNMKRALGIEQPDLVERPTRGAVIEICPCGCMK